MGSRGVGANESPADRACGSCFPKSLGELEITIPPAGLWASRARKRITIRNRARKIRRRVRVRGPRGDTRVICAKVMLLFGTRYLGVPGGATEEENVPAIFPTRRSNDET